MAPATRMFVFAGSIVIQGSFCCRWFWSPLLRLPGCITFTFALTVRADAGRMPEAVRSTKASARGIALIASRCIEIFEICYTSRK